MGSYLILNVYSNIAKCVKADAIKISHLFLGDDFLVSSAFTNFGV